MKFFRTLMMLASLSVALSAGNVVLTTDPLTGLPIDPKSDPGMDLGNAPVKMDDHADLQEQDASQPLQRF